MCNIEKLGGAGFSACNIEKLGGPGDEASSYSSNGPVSPLTW